MEGDSGASSPVPFVLKTHQALWLFKQMTERSGEGFEPHTEPPERKPMQSEAGAEASEVRGEEGLNETRLGVMRGVDNDKSVRGVEGKSLLKTPFVLRTHQVLWLSHVITG